MSLNKFQYLLLEEIGVEKSVYSKFISKKKDITKGLSLESNNENGSVSTVSFLHDISVNNTYNVNELKNQSIVPTYLSSIYVLKDEITSCKKCFLCNYRKNIVFGTGVLSDVACMIIGEAPGEYEDIEGIPFVGKSGKLLDLMLSSISISRASNAFISNIVKCRPPGNRNPKPEEIDSCRPYLIDQIDIISPRTILALGKFAANALLRNDYSIRNLRGKVHSFKSRTSNIPVVVSYHPAYLLRRPEEKSLAWRDLCLLYSILEK